jgi:glutamate racemase
MIDKDLSSYSIGLFDSGVGGLTVMQEIARLLPNENLIYLGDTARVPYGNKSSGTIIRYSIENAIFLLEKQIKILIIACNTASALALCKLRQIFNIPILGVIEPGAQQAAATTRNKRIAVLGTKSTIESGAYQKAILTLLPQATIFPISCPLLVPLVEEQFLYHPASKLIIENYLKELKYADVDTILLGCTHYPLLKHFITDIMGSKVTVVDSASTCATAVKTLLESNQLAYSHNQALHRYFVTDDPDKFRYLGEHLFQSPLPPIELHSIY